MRDIRDPRVLAPYAMHRLCPASPEKEDQRAAGRPAALTQLALCLRLASNLRPKADNAPKTLDDSTPNEDYVKYKCGVSNLFIALESSSSG
jgi:hypothetical protein